MGSSATVDLADALMDTPAHVIAQLLAQDVRNAGRDPLRQVTQEGREPRALPAPRLHPPFITSPTKEASRER